MWVFSSAPVLELGGGTDVLSGVTGSVRVGEAVVVAVGADAQLRFYDPGGKLMRRVGRRGNGPGEFQHLGWIGTAPGDSIVAWDPILRRLTYFSPRGDLGRVSTPTHLDGFLPAVLGMFSDGSVLLSAGMGPSRSLDGKTWRDTLAYLHASADGTQLDTVGRFPGPEVFGARSPSGVERVYALPFGRVTVTAVARDRFVVGTGDSYELTVYGADGIPQVLIRRRRAGVAVTDTDKEDFLANRIAQRSTGGAAEERMRMLRDAPYPDRMAPYVGVVMDAAGRAWVREAQPPGTWDAYSRWSVYDARGRWVGDVDGPGRFSIHQAGTDWVLGSYIDGDHVEYVRLYHLRPARVEERANSKG
jgi:hypothetical protein